LLWVEPHKAEAIAVQIETARSQVVSRMLLAGLNLPWRLSRGNLPMFAVYLSQFAAQSHAV